MGKEVLMFGNIEIEKIKFYHHKTPTFFFFFFAGMGGSLLSHKILRKYLYLTRFCFVKKPINILLVTCIMIIKLSHYI